MNITKDFHDFLNTTDCLFSQFKFKIEKYSPMDKCSRLFRQIKEVENQLEHLLSISKKSSSFNNSHLKFSSASVKINQSLKDIEADLNQIKEKDLYLCNNKYSKKIISNSLDILNQKISDLSYKFHNFLKTQAETIRRIEDRKFFITSNNKSKKINNYNEYAINYDENKNNNDEEDVLLDVGGHSQTTMKKNEQYYSYRLNAAQGIEKMMSEISGMTKRMSHMIYEHGSLIQKIGQNTDISLDNIEKGAKEVKEIRENVKGNRALLIRIFLIIIVVSVIYILFFA